MEKKEAEKKIALILGGTSPHKNLIMNLKQRGFYTVLVDYLKNAPAISVADEYVCASTLDTEKILGIAQEKKADVVISTCIDQANRTCCYVAEKLGLPKPYDYQTALNVTDKGLMKKIMLENQIPPATYMVVQDVTDIQWNKITYPAVIKPVDCNSSKGVHRADSAEEVTEYVENALQLSRTKNAIIEDFNEGREIQVDCFAENDDAVVIMTREKRKIERKNQMVLQSYGSIIPASLSEKVKKQTTEIAKKIAKSFGLKNTPFFYQAIVTDETIHVLEFAPRIGGGLSSYLIKLVTGFDVLDAAVDSFLGNTVNVNYEQSSKYYATDLLYMRPGIFDHIEGVEQLKEQKIIKEFFQLKEKGAVIDKDMCSSNRIAAFIVEAENLEEMYAKSAKAFAEIEIYDADGVPLLNREVCNVKGENHETSSL